MKLARFAVCLALLSIVIGLVGCGATPAPATYTDPFAYCAAVGTIDTPDAAYSGPAVPQSVGEGLQKALNVPDMPLDMLINGSSCCLLYTSPSPRD